MRIIKQGQLPEEKVYQTTCMHCKTVFEFKRHEGTVESHRNEDYVSVNCPFCHKQMYVDY